MDPNISAQPPQPITPETQTPVIQPSSSSNKTKYILLGLLALLIIVAVGGVSYYLGAVKQQPAIQENNNITTATAIPTQTTTPTITPDPTASWKTFTRNFVNFGISLKYPSDFYIINSGGTGAADYIGDSANTVNNIYLAGKSLQNNQLLISVVTLAESYSDMQKLANRIAGGAPQNVPYSTVSIGGLQAVKVIYNNVESYGIIHDSQNFTWISAQPANSIQIQTFEKMINTFKFTNQTSQAVKPSQSVIVSPDSVVQDYYNWWLSCSNQKISGAKVDCSYNQTGVLTDTLVTKLNQASGFDPILCAQNIPEKINFDNAVIANTDTATVEVHTVWGSSPQQNISVGLQQISNQWKISSIDCNK